MATTSTKQRLDAFSIRKNPKGGSSFWTKCGVAFINRDGSINLKLHLVPLDGEVHLRTPKPKDQQGQGGDQLEPDTDAPEAS